jgi:RNA polymerase sigma-70 factor (ECF subfamily)
MDDAARAALERAIAEAMDREDFAAAATLTLRGYGPEVFGLLVAVARDESAASEMFSQFNEDLWRGLPGFRRGSSFRTWAYVLAHNAASRWRRDPLRRRGVDFEERPELLAIEAHVRTETLPHLRTEAKDRMREVRAELAVEDQMLLALRVDRELPWDDIVEVVFGPCDGPTRARHTVNLRKRFERIKRRLRVAFERDPSLRR